LALEATTMVNEYERMLMDEDPQPRDEVEREYWLEPHLPYALKQRVETVFDVLAHLPLKQPLAVVSDAGKTIAANRALVELLGGKGADYVGRSWMQVMPGWAQRVPGFRREGEQVFEEHLTGVDGEQRWVRVSLGPVAERGEERAMAYLLFINKPDVETIDHDEVRRLRKSLQLLADTQTDYVVEIDRAGVMTFVSPSFCRAVGAQEGELVGHEFLSRVCEADRAAAAAALDEAGKPPFIGEMQARLAADPRVDLDWHIDAVIGDGIVGLDLVGRIAGAERPAAPAPRAATRPPAEPQIAAQATPAAAAPEDPRLARIREKLAALDPSDQESLMALARAVADAAGAECVLYNVQRGDAIESAVGWRLPPTA
jgi:PAS domain S-box-containing protein